MNKLKILITLVSILFVSVMSVLSVITIDNSIFASGNTYYVDPIGTNDVSHGTSTGAGAFLTIQYAVDFSSAGDTIDVASGTYNEQIYVSKALTVQGDGYTTIIQPSNLTRYLVTPSVAGSTVCTGAIVVNSSAGDVIIKDLKVDASSLSSNRTTWFSPAVQSMKFAGISYYNSNGTIDNVFSTNTNHITIATTGASTWGRQVQSFKVDANATTPISVEIKNSIASNFLGEAISVGWNNPSATQIINIHNNTIIGDGSVTNRRQNGINVYSGFTVISISYNTIQDLVYRPTMNWATGIAVSDIESGAMIGHNNISNCDFGITDTFSSGVTIYQNIITGSDQMYGTGIYLDNGVANVSGVIVHGNIIGSGFPYGGICLRGWYAGDNTISEVISNNILTGNSLSDGYGIFDDSGAAGDIDATIFGNTITGWTKGISIESGAPIEGFTIASNSIYGNTLGLKNNCAEDVDAVNNWWGSDSGPYHSSNPTGVGDEVSDNVTFSPWSVRDNHWLENSKFINDGGQALDVWYDEVTLDYIYVANGDDGLRAYKQKAVITNVGHIDDGGIATSVWKNPSDTYIYLANGEDGLRAYTFDGTSFTNVGHVDTDGYATKVYGRQGYIYLADGVGGLKIYSFNGTTFTLLDSVAGDFTAVWCDANYYYAGGTNGLSAYTFDGMEFTLKGNINDIGLGSAEDINGDEECPDHDLFFAKGTAGLGAYSFDGTNFSNIGNINSGGTAMSVIFGVNQLFPHAHTTVLTPGGPLVEASYGYVYLANGYDGLRAYEFNGSSFINVGWINNGAYASGLCAEINYAHPRIYLANTLDGLRVYKITGTVTITADPLSIPADGVSTTLITVTALDYLGNPVPDGTDIVFTTSAQQGYWTSTTLTKHSVGGIATAVLTSLACPVDTGTDHVDIIDVSARCEGVSSRIPVFFTVEHTTSPVSDLNTYVQTIEDSGSMLVLSGSRIHSITIDATGQHQITATRYTENPINGDTSNMQEYYDVHLDNIDGVNSLSIDFPVQKASTTINYWNGISWAPVSNQLYRSSSEYTYAKGITTVTITATSSPSLDDLGGLHFGSLLAASTTVESLTDIIPIIFAAILIVVVPAVLFMAGGFSIFSLILAALSFVIGVSMLGMISSMISNMW